MADAPQDNAVTGGPAPTPADPQSSSPPPAPPAPPSPPAAAAAPTGFPPRLTPKPAPAHSVRWGLVGLMVALVLFGLAAYNLFQLPSEPGPAMEMGAASNLKSLATAQEQHKQKTGKYATSAKAIAADTSGPPPAWLVLGAWEVYMNNGDASPAIPDRYGYLYRMLQGRVGEKRAFAHEGSPAGSTHWAAIARAVQRRSHSGHKQFLITEMGQVFEHAEPPETAPNYDDFLLDALPDAFTADGGCDNEKLNALGWTPVQ